MNPNFESVITIAKKMAEEAPDLERFTFVDDSGKSTGSFNSKQIWERANQIASGLLQGHALKPGARVLLVYPPGLEFVEAFLGCLIARLIPVPVSPPVPLKPEIGLAGYTAIALDSGASAQLTCQSYSRTRTFGRILQALKSGPKWPDLPWIITDTIQSKANISITEPGFNDLAFLQYTSGSTRAPRGVCVTFGNIWAQTQLLRNELGMQVGGVSVFWMPHYHDFLLIGGILNAVGRGNHLVLFSAAGFLRKPALWPELIDRYRATHIGSPDFGYRLLTLKTETSERVKWDLSSLKVVMSAAEPIRARTVDGFLSAFQESKLDPSAFNPSYGLAEHTLAVTLNGKKRFQVERDQTTVELFGCGRPSMGVAVKIVNPETCVPVKDGESGEIWLSSANKTHGYYGRPEESLLKFEAKLNHSSEAFLRAKDANEPDSWLRTGDLGAILGEELVVLGRLDDMILFRGRNIYPQDAEGLVSDSDERIRTGRVLAFAIPSEEGDAARENELGIVIELKSGHEQESVMDEIAANLRVLLQQELGIPGAVLIFSPQGTIPKTSSGKLQRTKCRAQFLAGSLPALKLDRGL